MPDVIEAAKSGRASCRGCGEKLAKGELRFGEALPNAYGEGEALHWFHLACAACMRPEKLAEALPGAGDVPEPDWLRAMADAGKQHYRLARLSKAQRSPSGRARCRSCRELIEKGAWRLVLQIWEEGRMEPIGFIHASCAAEYFGTTATVMERVARLTADLAEADLSAIRAEVAPGGPVKARAAAGPGPAKVTAEPGDAGSADAEKTDDAAES